MREFVVRDKVAGNSFAIVGAKEFGGRVPKLTGIAIGLGVELVFEVGVALAQLPVEFGIVAHGVEVEGLAGAEDDHLLGKIAVVGVV